MAGGGKERLASPQQETDTSSIGPQWPPRESSFDRIKGIDNRSIIRNDQHFEEVLNEVKDLREKYIHNGESSLDRISVRLFVRNDVWLNSLDEIEDLGDAIIPLMNTGEEFNDVSLIYLGANSSERQPNDEELQKCISNAREALKREPV